MSPPPSVAAKSLATFLEENHVSQTDAAEALGVTKAVLGPWLDGRTRPRAELRLLIERWTKRAVRALDWLTEEEKQAIARVIPYRRAQRNQVPVVEAR